MVITEQEMTPIGTEQNEYYFSRISPFGKKELTVE